MHRSTFLAFAAFFVSTSIASAASLFQERADRFLKLADAGYQALYRVNSEAQPLQSWLEEQNKGRQIGWD